MAHDLSRLRAQDEDLRTRRVRWAGTRDTRAAEQVDAGALGGHCDALDSVVEHDQRPRLGND
jgi:hypothetical protein